MERHWRLCLLLGLIPPVLYVVGIALPVVDGPHVWLGLPSLVWWMCLSAVSVSAVLACFERMRGGDPE